MRNKCQHALEVFGPANVAKIAARLLRIGELASILQAGQTILLLGDTTAAMSTLQSLCAGLLERG
jgi:hypothetical protein